MANIMNKRCTTTPVGVLEAKIEKLVEFSIALYWLYGVA